MLHLAAAGGHGVDHAEIAPPFSNPAQPCVSACVCVCKGKWAYAFPLSSQPNKGLGLLSSEVSN